MTAEASADQRIDELARGRTTDAQLPSRHDIDRLWQHGDDVGWTEPTARAVEYLDARREIADERYEAWMRGDQAEVVRLDQQQEALDRGLRVYLEGPEREAEHHDVDRGDDEPEELEL